MSRLRPVAAFAVVMVMLVPGAALAGGNTAGQLEDAGYFCFNAGPDNWTHCIKTQHIDNPSIPVKVFSEDGSEFFGTELLLRSDIYNGQPCPQDNLATWQGPTGPGDNYFACHHFDTGRN